MSAFKAYDIRGEYGRDFDAQTVYRVGRALPAMLDAPRVLVGRDDRRSSPDVHEALCRGLLDAGADVDDLGLATTPMVYYIAGERDYPASVMITASHNPPTHNGLKISRATVLPVGRDSGLLELEAAVATAPPPPTARRGRRHPLDARADYLAFLRRHLPDLGGLRVAIDGSNGMAGLLLRDLFGTTPRYLHETVDGRFPNHSPNPLDPAATAELRRIVTAEELDIGVIFDGDADRVMFIDERGRFVRPDLLIALLGRHYLEHEPGAAVLCDIRTSRGVFETLRELGAVTHMGKVGHAFAKVRMRELQAVVGGELAGHYYFRDFFGCDAALLCAEIVLGVVAAARRTGVSFSELLRPIDRYANSGERNYAVEHKAEAIEALRAWVDRSTPPEAVHDFDGYRFEWPDGWFNVRPSNTEPYLRLIVEAANETALAERLKAIETVLQPFFSTP